MKTFKEVFNQIYEDISLLSGTPNKFKLGVKGKLPFKKNVGNKVGFDDESDAKDKKHQWRQENMFKMKKLKSVVKK